MAKRPDTKAIPACRVWQALLDGSVTAVPLQGTRMLHVQKGRIRYNWVEKGDVKHARVRLNGRYLNPRWIPIPSWYDLSIDQIGFLTKDELIARGLIKRLGEWRLLIYQQLDDVCSLHRQLEDHIYNAYDQEELKLWEMADQIEFRRVLGVGDGVRARILSARLGVVVERIKYFKKRLEHIRGLIGLYIRTLPNQGTISMLQKGVGIGISEGLKHQNESLLIFNHERLLWPRVHWARVCLSKASTVLRSNGDADVLEVRRYLERALRYLQWPVEEA